MTKLIKIPHLAYTLKIKQPIKGYVAAARRVSMTEGWIHIVTPIKPVQYPVLAHEIVHILRYIAIDYKMDFANEEEHFAYLMQYIMNKILGYEMYDKN